MLTKIKATKHIEDKIYIMNEKNDIYEISLWYDGTPIIKAYKFNSPQWPSELITEAQP